MKPASVVGFIAAVLATCAAGVFVGRHFNTSNAIPVNTANAIPEPPTGGIGICRLSVTDCHMKVTQDILQFRTGQATFGLNNDVYDTVEISAIAISCADSTVSDLDNVPLDFPITIKRGGTRFLLLNLSGGNRIGKTNCAMQFTCKTDGSPRALRIPFQFNVVGGLELYPPFLGWYDVLPGQVCEADVKVRDAYRGDIIGLQSVTSTNDYLTGTLTRVDDEEPIQVGSTEFQTTYNLHVKMIVPDLLELQQEYLYLVPGDARYPKIVFPVVFRAKPPPTAQGRAGL